MYEYIYYYNWLIFMANVGEYTSPMHPMRMWWLKQLFRVVNTVSTGSYDPGAGRLMMSSQASQLTCFPKKSKHSFSAGS